MRKYEEEASRIKLLGKWDYEMVSRLVEIVQELTAINTEVSSRLGEALLELEKANRRIEWYRNMTFRQAK